MSFIVLDVDELAVDVEKGRVNLHGSAPSICFFSCARRLGAS
jgi:hypothetical protein